MSDKQTTRGFGSALARRVQKRLEVDLSTMPPGEQALVAGGLMFLDRAVGVLEKLDTAADIQLETARLSRRVLEMFPPLVGKLGELIEVELEIARKRLTNGGDR